MNIKSKKFTFKTIKPTSKYKWLEPTLYKILLDKNIVGEFRIEDDSTWSINLLVLKTDKITDNNPNSHNKWIRLKHRSSTLDEAKEYINKNFVGITTMYKFELN